MQVGSYVFKDIRTVPRKLEYLDRLLIDSGAIADDSTRLQNVLKQYSSDFKKNLEKGAKRKQTKL